MKNKKIGIIIVIIGIILIIIGMVNMIPKKQTNIEIINDQLNNEQLQVLIKEMQKYITPVASIENNSKVSFNEMIQFTFSYISYLDKDNKQVLIDEEKSQGIISVDVIKENVKYLFGIDNIDLSLSTYEIKNGKIYIPLNLQGGDAQIYKYVETTHNEQTGQYIAKIDCLEIASADDVSNLLEKTEYNKEDVVFTLLIKYKIVEGRKVLLAYSTYSNL